MVDADADAAAAADDDDNDDDDDDDDDDDADDDDDGGDLWWMMIYDVYDTLINNNDVYMLISHDTQHLYICNGKPWQPYDDWWWSVLIYGGKKWYMKLCIAPSL